jgi:hypothetical protein
MNPTERNYMNIYCPICSRKLGPNESLQIGHDSIGSLIVWHMVPASVPTRTNQTDEEFHAQIAAAPKIPGADNMRHICGLAGFTPDSVRTIFPTIDKG